MAAWVLPAAMMAMSLLKSKQEQEQRKEDLLLEAKKTRGAYYTGNTGQRVARPQSPWQSVAEAGLGGYATGQNMEMAEKNRDFQQKYTKDQQKINAHLAGMSLSDDAGWLNFRDKQPYEDEYLPSVNTPRRPKYSGWWSD